MSGWKRIGIIASVVWILGAGIFTYHGMHNFLTLEGVTNQTPILLKSVALIAFSPLLLGWGLAYLILFLVNWVRRGFISPGNSN